jgi:hypothetical protein
MWQTDEDGGDSKWGDTSSSTSPTRSVNDEPINIPTGSVRRPPPSSSNAAVRAPTTSSRPTRGPAVAPNANNNNNNNTATISGNGGIRQSMSIPANLSQSQGATAGHENGEAAHRYQQSLAAIKGSYSEQLKRLAEQLSGMVTNASGDAVLLAMARDPASLQYVQPRLLEMLAGSINLESTRAAETATEQLARRSAELAELREQFTKFQQEATIRDQMLTQKERMCEQPCIDSLIVFHEFMLSCRSNHRFCVS